MFNSTTANSIKTFYFSGWLFLLFTLTLMRMGWLIIDEEFFIVGAFCGFLVLAHGAVAQNLSDGFAARIASIFTAASLSRGLALQTLAQLYEFYQTKIRLNSVAGLLRAGLATEFTTVLISRSMDYQSLLAQREIQRAELFAYIFSEWSRFEYLNGCYKIYGVIKDPEILDPVVANLGLDNLSKLFDQRARRADLPAHQMVAAMAFLAVDADCTELF